MAMYMEIVKDIDELKKLYRAQNNPDMDNWDDNTWKRLLELHNKRVTEQKKETYAGFVIPVGDGVVEKFMEYNAKALYYTKKNKNEIKRK